MTQRERQILKLIEANPMISQQALEQEAEERIIASRQQDGCTLECAGYLDLFGNAWGCVVQGDGWVEVVVIRSVAESACSVQTIRLEAEG